MTRKSWGLAVIVNLGAAVVAALAFGAWKRSQTPAIPPSNHSWFEPVEDVGFIPKANSKLNARSGVDGRDATYTIGPDHFRVVPEAITPPDACVLVFGDSFSFGDGVADDETFSAQIVKQSRHRVAVQNLAMSGWGPHQFLAGLQSGRFRRAVRCSPTDAVFLMIPSLIWRANGVFNSWDAKGPRYRLGAGGRPVREGTLGDPDPYNWRRWIGLTPVSRRNAMKLALAIIVEATNELKRLYPGIRMHFISYRVASWGDVDLTREDMFEFEYDLQQAGIIPLPLEAAIPRYRFAMQDYVLSSADLHPSPRAHRLIAEFILREIAVR
jgi:hypothetical protein